MAVATVPLGPNKYSLNQLDRLLFEICEELQLPPYRYNQAEERYHAVSEVLDADGSPLSPFPAANLPAGLDAARYHGPTDCRSP